MKKIKTNILGLDHLLHGGLQIDTGTGISGKSSLNSLVIVLRGKKGVSKHLFAMQLMHGIARSLAIEHHTVGLEPSAYYYSINKTTDKLEDSYIDFLILKWLNFMTHESRLERLGYSDNDKAMSSKEIKHQLYEFFFDTELKKEKVYDDVRNQVHALHREYGDKAMEFLTENILTYNPRTNSLHFKRPYVGDSPENLWAVRECDTIGEYLARLNNPNFASIKNSNNKFAKYLKEILIKVVFNGHLSRNNNSKEARFGDIGNMERYSKTASVIYEDILSDMEQELDKALNPEPTQDQSNWSVHEDNSAGCVEAKHPPFHDVLVIDGFSQLDNEHLKTLQFSHLHKVARRMARVTILVLDEREDALCDGDIVIELHKDEDAGQEYTYRRLQVVKSSFQEVAYGWHQYKIQSDGIRVFPSIHFLLSKRYYLQSRTHDIGQGIYEDSFEEFLDSRLHLGNSNPRAIGDKDNKEFLYKEYEAQRKIHHRSRFQKILDNHRKWKNLIAHNDDNSADGEYGDIMLNYFTSVILGHGTLSSGNPDKNPKAQCESGHPCSRCDPRSLSDEIYCWDKRYPTTVIIGNPNSFKRRMALGKAYHWAQKKEHVMIVLFGKNDDSLRKQLICPALHRGICAEINKSHFQDIKPCLTPEEALDNEVYGICSKCEKFIHFYRFRMGCITPDELFYRLEEQIKTYADADKNNGIEKRRLHILIDDLQRVDFGFPFLDSTSLFTGALINLCHEHKVELTILCDKHSSRTKEVCALADNVVVLDRRPCDINNVKMWIEKCVEFPAPGAILEYKIGDVLNLFECLEIQHLYFST